jgi:hypothetical protein
MTLPTYTAWRYVAPLREGGSLPAILSTDGGDFVVKFRGAGQGARALLAELIVGGLAQALGLPVPEIALVHLPDGFGSAEPDPEIRDILRGSHGLNVGLRFLPGAFPFDPAAMAPLAAPDLAADIVWLDALTTNIDRTARNPNLLVSGSAADPRLWLIDHGAALYFHHNWPTVDAARAASAFPAIRDHVLLPSAGSLRDADARLAERLPPEVRAGILAAVPDDLLMAAPDGHAPPFETSDAARRAYLDYLGTRLDAPRAWAEAAEEARLARAAERPQPLPYRR